MTMEEFGRRIGMPDEGIRCAQQLSSCVDIPSYLSLLEEDEDRFLKAINGQPNAQALVLAVYMLYAMEQKKKFESRGLDSTVFFDTMRDLTVWYQACVRCTGKPGLIEWDWLLLSLKARLVRLGRLQYQPRRLKQAIQVEGREYPPGTAILEIHIPADGRLEWSAVLDSLGRAKSYYANEGYELFHCHSWLLSPALKKILPPGSNILRFQEAFTVYGEDFSFRQAEERVFGTILEDRMQYPETTSLQKSLKKLLLDGGRVGMGCGIIPFRTELHVPPI